MSTILGHRGSGSLLGSLAGDGGRVVVGRDDDLASVGLCEEGVEEGLGVCEAKLVDEAGVCDKAVAPAHGVRRLAAALNEEQCGGGHLCADRT